MESEIKDLDTQEQDNKVTLKYPIKTKNIKEEDIEITELTFGPIKAKVFKDMPRGSFGTEEDGIAPGALTPLIASSAGISIKDAEKIDFRDIAAITEKLTPFLA